MVDISIRSKRSKVIIGTVLSFVVVVFLITLIKKDIGVVAGLRQSIIANQNDINVLNKIYDDANNKRAEIDKVLATVPGSYEEVSTYAKVVESAASATNVTIELKLDSKEKKETSGIKSVGFSIKAVGSYENLVKFVGGVSELPYHIEVDSMDFEKKLTGIELVLSYRLYTNISK